MISPKRKSERDTGVQQNHKLLTEHKVMIVAAGRNPGLVMQIAMCVRKSGCILQGEMAMVSYE
jgi:hypothetical protein